MLKYFYKYQRFFVVLGAFLIQLSLGSMYSFGNIESYTFEYMHNKSKSGNSVVQANFIWIIGTLTIGIGASLSLGGYVEKKIGTFKTLLLGGWFMSLNVCLMAVTIKTYLSVVIITFGLFGGFGLGFVQGVTLRAPIKFFPNNEGLVLGIITLGFGCSSVIFNTIQDLILSGEGGIKCIDNLPKSFIVLGLIFGVLQLIGAILIKQGSKDETKEEFINSVSVRSKSTENFPFRNSRWVESHYECEPHHLIFETDFWILWMIYFINSFLLYFILVSHNTYLKQINIKYREMMGFTILSLVLTVCNCVGRIFWGYVLDKKPFKAIMLIMTVTNSIFSLTLPFISSIDALVVKYMFVVWLGVIFFVNSANYCVFPTMCFRLFGKRNFIFNYGMLLTSCSVSGTIVSIICMIFFSNKIDTMIYRNMCIIGSVMSLLAAIFTVLFRGKSLINYRY